MTINATTIRAVTPKQRKRALKKENRALRPAPVAKPKPAPIPDPWGTGKPVAAKQYAPRPATECLHVLAEHKLADEGRSRLELRTTFAYCHEGGQHDKHSDGSRSWS